MDYIQDILNNVPRQPRKTNKRLWKNLVFGPLTLGIYPIVMMCSVSNDINIVASKYDGGKTMHYGWIHFIFTPLTLGVVNMVWYHKLSNRIGTELRRRGLSYAFGCKDYWLWNVVGSLMLVGPFVYLHRLYMAVNLMNEDYHVNG